MKIFRSVSVLILLLFSATCTRVENKLKIAGSTTVLPIVQAAAEVYMEQHPQVSISVRGGGSSIGIKSIIGRIVDLGSASRQINEREMKLIAAQEKNLQAFPIARDALTIIVHPDNPVLNLTTGQLRLIYTGELHNWQQLGGPNLTIIPISRDVSSGSFEVFNHFILDSLSVASGAMVLASNNAVATTVSYTPGAIGYVGYGYAHEQVKIITLDGIRPQAESIISGDYPLSRQLYIYTPDKPEQLASDFIAFLLSEEGQNIVTQQGFIKLHQTEPANE
ncbi:MAG: PstS family phosphate ABC transporter substrate-binding protein [Candidatus Cloacimonetes bacterium]|nr:PstS family phosphate ABC transporter substrate-binding protein [Candidatus Cloacimonadota bacterium]